MIKKSVYWLLSLTLLIGLLGACAPSTDVTDVDPTDLLTTIGKRASRITDKPGWLHMTEDIAYDVDKENLDVLPDGTEIPLVHVSETWYHVNPNGDVYQYVNLLQTTDGDLVQVSIYVNSQVFNLATAEITPVSPYPLGAMDYLFSREMRDFIDNDRGNVTVLVTEEDGLEVAIFTLSETLDEPVTAEYYTESITGLRTVATFDYNSGFLIRLKRYRTLADGTERLFFSTDVVVEQVSLPPQNILDYVEKPQLIAP